MESIVNLTRSEIIKDIIWWSSSILGFLLLAYVHLYQRFLNPQLTETQLFLENAWQHISGIALICLSIYIIERGKFERKHDEILNRRKRENESLQ